MAEPQLDPSSTAQRQATKRGKRKTVSRPRAEDATAVLFQSNPDRWDLRRSLQPGEEENWHVKQYRGEMHSGRLVLLWEAKGRKEEAVKGLYGWGITTREVWSRANEAMIGLQYVERWVDKNDDARSVPDGEHVAAIPGKDMLGLPSWSQHRLNTMPMGTNFLVSREQLEELSERIVKVRLPDSRLPEAVSRAISGEAISPDLFEPVRVVVKEDRRVDPVALSDAATDEDHLGFDPYAKSIFEFLTHKETEPPLSIGVSASWGSGKTSLMSRIRRKLDEHREQVLKEGRDPRSPLTRICRTVWIDVWKYESSQSLWAALTREVYDQAQRQMTFLDRLRFRLALGLHMSEDRWPPILKGLLPQWIALAVTVAVWAYLSVETLVSGASAEIGVGTGLHGLFSVGAVTFVGLTKGLLRMPFSVDLGKYTDVPHNTEKIGYTAEAEEDIERMVELLTRDDKFGLVVFIDDLDRCSPAHVVEMVEAINLLFAGAKNRKTIFLLGMDADMVAASIRSAYKELVRELRARGNPAAADYGFRFLAKIVQLSFDIPEAGGIQLDTFANRLIGADGGPEVPDEETVRAYRAELEAATTIGEALVRADDLVKSSETEEQAVEEALSQTVVDRFSVDSKEVQEAILRGVLLLERRPRAVKRFINAFRLQVLVSNRVPSRGAKRPTLDQVAKWTAMRLRWPLFAEQVKRRTELLIDLENLAREPKQGDVPDTWPEPVKKLAVDNDFREILRHSPYFEGIDPHFLLQVV